DHYETDLLSFFKNQAITEYNFMAKVVYFMTRFNFKKGQEGGEENLMYKNKDSNAPGWAITCLNSPIKRRSKRIL
ncbi:hypothetical protein, partial [Bartonella bovis]|uniref:hypothetical protein n=1 Tax=Bartonella bovis TaxID=155194 RepID=UPI001ABA8289